MANLNLEQEILRRKTFAIISHPDAGKTTMTEKLLLYGGELREAGSVKARKAGKHAVSDWMDIEKQRGISVTSSVLQFEYNGNFINILDTPGHQDFSEDTYRTLVAADSVVMLIDGAKGVEAQTIKLFHVCKMRGIPIFTFVNKMDRAAKNPFELMEEIENVLGIRSCPMNWPIGTDGDFKGVYDRKENKILMFNGGNHGTTEVESVVGEIDDPVFADLLGDHYHDRLKEEIELLDMAGDPFDFELVQKGELTPMYFGSAMTNFGVEPFLQSFLEMAPAPSPRTSNIGEIEPTTGEFTGFVFKIQANMNKAHRDRLAFVRICSGKFTKGMEVNHVREGKKIRLAQPTQMMAQERTIVEEAYAGDIVGLFDPGIFKLGDTLTEKRNNIRYEGIPVFPAEHFAKISPRDSMKRKQFQKGIVQLAEEGTIQVFKQVDYSSETVIVGAVGVLQFEVLEHRLSSEYGVEIRIQMLPHKMARWIVNVGLELDTLQLTSTTIKATDREDRPVLITENEWAMNWALDKNKGLELRDIHGEKD